MSVEPQNVEPKLLPDGEPSVLVGTERRGRSTRLPWIIFIALSVVATGALLIYGGLPKYLQQEALVKHKKEQLSKAVSVSYVVAAPAPALDDFALPGATQAILDAPVFARVSGYIRKLHVNIGDQVHKGQILAEIDIPELDKQVQAASDSVRQARFSFENSKEMLSRAKSDALTAKANTQRARTDLNFAKLENDRYVYLAKQGVSSREVADTHQNNYNSALSTLQAAISSEESAQAQIRSATAAMQMAKAAMEQAQSQRDQYAASQSFKAVRAPFDGVVTRSEVDPGVLVTAGSNTSNTVLFEIAKTDVLRIFVYIPEQYVPFIYEGEVAKLQLPAFPRRSFTAIVKYIAGGLDPASRTLKAELHVPNQKHILLPGMYAQVHFQSPSNSKLAIVPGSAMQTRADGSFVYTVDDHQRVHLHSVKVEKDLGGRVEIASGIAVGDKVIISPSDDIIDGVIVNPVELKTSR